jgi:SAM-dependent methyltransferase
MSQMNATTIAEHASSSLAPDPDRVGDRDARANFGNRGPEPCVICGQAGGQELLRAPDRLHGRPEKYTLVRCPDCSLVWLSHPPKPEEMDLHYTDAYHKLISAAGENSARRWHDRLQTVRQHKQSGTMLDLGCSSGGFLGFFRGDPWMLYGIEMSADCARRAEERTGADVFVGDILDAPFRSQSFDVITCFDVLEHLYEPRRVLEKVGEWLKPGGIFYVQVPNIDSAEARVFGTYWHGLELPRHLFHYSPTSLRKLAKATGFREVSLETRRNPAVGTGLRYVWDSLFRAFGMKPTPLAYRGKASLPWRAARKLVRMTVLRGLLAMAPLVGDGEAIHAVFRKDT